MGKLVIRRMLIASILILVFRCTNEWIHKCPRLEDIHPCSCNSIHIRNPEVPDVIVLCRNINEQVLTSTLRGMRNYSIDIIIFDNCKIPSFPNTLFKDIRIGSAELLYSTVQINNFLQCV